jgi:DNA-binding XRE family transcriptional regulator
MDYGLGPDEVYPDFSLATERIIHLIESGDPTERPIAVRLAELRQSRGLSQVEVAERAGVKQANIARIEGRDDLKISTLVKVVEAMGATLSIRARFPDGTERELEF